MLKKKQYTFTGIYPCLIKGPSALIIWPLDDSLATRTSKLFSGEDTCY